MTKKSVARVYKKAKKRKGAPKEVAAPPGVIGSDPDAHPTSVKVVAYSPSQVNEWPALGFQALPKIRAENSVVWLDVVGLADTELLARLGQTFGLHPLALEDVVSLRQRPKAESYAGHMFLIIHMPSQEDPAEIEQVSIFLGDGFVISFQERPGDCFGSIRQRLRAETGRMRAAGADYLAYALVDAITDAYFPLLEQFGEQLEVLEDEIISDPQPDDSKALHALKRDLLQIRRAVWPTREMLNTLLRDDHTHFTDSTKLFLRDTYDHSVQLMDIVETYREIASGLLDVYLSAMSQRMNEIMKVLTIISTIFIPLGFLAGVWGMNFDTSHPLNMPELEWAYGYPAALGLMTMIALLLVWFFWRKGWMGKD